MSAERICSSCGWPIAPDDPVDHLGEFITHRERWVCVRIMKQKIGDLESDCKEKDREIAKLIDEMTGHFNRHAEQIHSLGETLDLARRLLSESLVPRTQTQ